MNTLFEKIKKPEEVNQPKEIRKIISLNFLRRLRVIFRSAFVNAEGNYRAKRIVLILHGSLGLVLLLGIMVMVRSENADIFNLSQHDTQQSKIILNQLGDIHGQLTRLASSPQNSKEFKQALLNVSADAAYIKKTVLAEEETIQQLSHQVLSLHQAMDEEMSDLKTTLTNPGNKHYLDAKVLPFHVISIDVMSQQPFVSVDYDHRILPLTLGDSLAGWQVTEADYALDEVEFKYIGKNNKNNSNNNRNLNHYVKVLL